jgi:uncharacterized membrane protein
MDFHDPLLVFNFNVLFTLTILVVVVSIYINYLERKERKNAAARLREPTKRMH